MNKIHLNKKQQKLIAEFKSIDNFIKGAVFVYERVCGKSNCKCKKTGEKHKSLFLSYRGENKNHLVPIKKSIAKKVEQWSNNYKKLREIINELTKVNVEIIKLGGVDEEKKKRSSNKK